LSAAAEIPPGCPAHAGRDDRKSGALAAALVRPRAEATTVARSFAFARDVLRNPDLVQGSHSGDGNGTDLTSSSVFFLEGDEHRRRRTAIAKFLTPKAISTRHRLVMERTADDLITQLRADGGGRIDDVTFRMAVAVAAEIVGLTDSDQLGMSRRISRSLLSTRLTQMSGWRKSLATVAVSVHALNFYLRDVRPAVATRRRERREDVISHLIDEKYPVQGILIECMTYAVAGMVTTREFMVMAAWHLFDDDALRARFVAGEPADQLAILEEILRLEPVAAMLHRQAPAASTMASGSVAAGELVAISLRDANVDEDVVGECPLVLDPDRAKRIRMTGSYMSFGDGSHRCPGAQVALNESRVFLDRLFTTPGLRLARRPDMTWNNGLMSYELRDMMVTCDR
jgi:cytochrome P450